MNKNYKLQITNYKQNTNYNVQNYKGNVVFEVDQALNQLTINPKGSHGLHRDSLGLQSMTALIKSFCGEVQMLHGAVFSKSAPLAAGGKKDE
jgi:hypothetical protein